MKKIIFLLLISVSCFSQVKLDCAIDCVNPTFSTVTTPTLYGGSASGANMLIQSTSHATKGTITFGSSTGTVSVPALAVFTNTGTTSFTGIVSTNSLIGTGQTRIYSGTNQDLYLRASGASNFVISEINGTQKFNVNSGGIITTGTVGLGGSTVLTGGNSGTVAVLSDAVFSVLFTATSSNPADATTYYWGNSGYPLYAAGVASGTVALPYNCTLVAWSYSGLINSTVSSAETATLSVRANNSTDTDLSTAITFSVANGINGYSGSGLSVSFTAGDRINAKLLTPTWVTNPVQLYSGLTLWFVRRQ